MFGIVFWIVIAVGVLGYVGVGLNRVMAQRHAWKAFAQKHKLTFEKGDSLYASGMVTGDIAGRELQIYSAGELRGNLYLRAHYVHIEVFLKHMPPMKLLVVAKSLPEVIGDVRLPIEFTVPGAKIAQTDDAQKAKDWLGQNRHMSALSALMQDIGKDDDVLFYADGDQAFFVWRTMGMMHDVRVLNARVQKLFGHAKDLDV